jgi:2',3'-cyclic-nucleotide 2'-phosphodiesterase/3'-nucleotidase
MSLCGEFAKELETPLEGQSRLHVRLLATSDLHANLLPYNYYTDTRDDAVGLVRVAGLIEAARADAPNCLVLDNGDTLQGAPLGDVAVADMLPRGDPHPMVAAMNAIGYDAATLGNHDFDYGIGVLDAALSRARFPVVLANAQRADGGPFRPGHVILRRMMRDRAGELQELRVGITGTVPPQVAQWNRMALGGELTFSCSVASVAREAAEMRAAGADLVVVLAHAGLGEDEVGAGEGENTALSIAALPDVDAVIAGHTHEVFPEASACTVEVPDTPIVQPGSSGSHLGCIDLALERRDSAQPDGSGRPARWTLVKARAEAIPITAPSDGRDRLAGLRRLLRNNPGLRRQVAGQHRATRRFTGRELGASAVPLNTYFSFLAPCAATQLVSDAQLAAAREAVAGEPELRGLPLLSAVAPFRSGGRSGAHHYTDIPAGPLLLRHAADLYCYPNLLAVLRVRGSGLRCWLERSASLYRQIDPEDPSPQLLIDHAFASYNFDRIGGLHYDIDVSRPARTTAHGDRTFENGGRVRNLRFADGTPVAPDDEVLVVTNSYRAAGGGHFRACLASETVLTGTHPVRDHVVQYIREAGEPLAPEPDPTFRLRGLGRAAILVETGPGALRHPERAAELGLTHAGDGDFGFVRFSLAR